MSGREGEVKGERVTLWRWLDPCEWGEKPEWGPWQIAPHGTSPADHKGRNAQIVEFVPVEERDALAATLRAAFGQDENLATAARLPSGFTTQDFADAYGGDCSLPNANGALKRLCRLRLLAREKESHPTGGPMFRYFLTPAGQAASDPQGSGQSNDPLASGDRREPLDQGSASASSSVGGSDDGG